MVEVLVVLSFVLAAGFSVLMGVALVTYVRHTWRLMRAEEEGSPQDRILDGLEELRIQLDLVGERMARMERTLEEGASRRELPPGNGDEPDGAR